MAIQASDSSRTRAKKNKRKVKKIPKNHNKYELWISNKKQYFYPTKAKRLERYNELVKENPEIKII